MVVTAGTVYVQMPARRRPGIGRYCHRCGLPFHASQFGWEVLGWLFPVGLYFVIQVPHSPFVGFYLRCRCSAVSPCFAVCVILQFAQFVFQFLGGAGSFGVAWLARFGFVVAGCWACVYS